MSMISIQSCKLLRHPGIRCPVGLRISSRILRKTPALFVMSRIFALIFALFGYFWFNLADFRHFWVDFGHIPADFEHFLTAFISRFWDKGSGAQKA